MHDVHKGVRRPRGPCCVARSSTEYVCPNTNCHDCHRTWCLFTPYLGRLTYPGQSCRTRRIVFAVISRYRGMSPEVSTYQMLAGAGRPELHCSGHPGR